MIQKKRAGYNYPMGKIAPIGSLHRKECEEKLHDVGERRIPTDNEYMTICKRCGCSVKVDGTDL